MPRNEDGEMELVLGNRQLLSVLFILVVLLGVFFTMGYIVGRNNPSEEKVRLAAAKQQVANANKLPPVTVDPDSGTVVSKPTPAPVEVPAPSGPVTVEPSRKEERKKEVKSEEAKKETAKKEDKKKEKEPKKQEEPARGESAGSLFQQAPVPGQYLQVAAIDRPGATGMAEAYRKQGFPALITPSSSATLFRVVIGPLKSSEAVADTKLRLKKIGVDGAILRKF
ncbi:MAG TPA: SPOR domain-containing protein [Bryobacteraceae bacterium]|nr:SPOR domain-containing protein [Bryobacteraceae bacterium]